MISLRWLVCASKMARAAVSASMMKGIGKVLPAMRSVCTNPGRW